MATHPGMLLAYDAAGHVIATLDQMVLYANDAVRTPIALVDFEGHEEKGLPHTDYWAGPPNAAGIRSWPEWIGGRAHDFRVELAAGRIGALVHRKSGYRRERAPLEAALNARIAGAGGRPADIRDLVGGPSRHLELDDDGRTLPWQPLQAGGAPAVEVAGGAGPESQEPAGAPAGAGAEPQLVVEAPLVGVDAQSEAVGAGGTGSEG